ncbi:MAG: hypothetical protein EOO38_17880 [Cytophagaceae bacterium]|nr:MAG: hypothetical protein EOO38_17880 [Cytophagaceae bacterium]
MEFLPALVKYVAYMDWSDRRMQELEDAKLKADRERAAIQKEVAELRASLLEQTEGFEQIRKGNEAQLQALNKR